VRRLVPEKNPKRHKLLKLGSKPVRRQTPCRWKHLQPHTKNVKIKKFTAYEILQCLYVDAGAFPFGTREDLQRGMELIYHHFVQFGLEMHIGRGTSESKTNCVPPPPQLFQRLERTSTAASTIQCAFRRTHHTHSGRIATEEPPKISKHPTQRLSHTCCPPRASPLDAGSLLHHPIQNIPTPMAQ
jgi:hypothetical protein